MKFLHVQGVGTKARFGWSAIDNPSHFETCLYHRFGIRGYGTSSFLHDFRDTGVSGHAPSAQGNRNFSLVWLTFRAPKSEGIGIFQKDSL